MAKKLKSVDIRMYRQGFGDCFLLTFRYPSGKKHLMIDFGVLKSSKGESKMKDIAEDILKTTQKKIDTLVVTHQHWDHYSGFTKSQAQDIIKQLSFDKLWLAWTEDFENPQAKALLDRRNKVKEAVKIGLKGMAEHYNKLTMASETQKTKFANQLKNIVGILNFESGIDQPFELSNKKPEEVFGLLGSNKIDNDDRSLVDILKELWSDIDQKKDFLEPNTMIDSKSQGFGLDGVRIYVLGPPSEWEYLRRNDTAAKGELYISSSLFDNPTSFINSFEFSDDERKKDWNDNDIPFEESWIEYIVEDNKITFEDDNKGLRGSEHKRIRNAIQSSEAFRQYNEESEFNKLRRIDNEYLSYIEPLALMLNSHTNNTSLVLAIELIDSGKVLLFPGDAQYGNWLSWTDKKLEWEFKEGDKSKKVSIEELLSRTVFYKVSHHGSHNGTPQNKGLELMKDKSLIAAVPVDKVAAEEKNWNKIPYSNIMKRLEEKVKKINGKPAILRSDSKPEEIPVSTQIRVNELYFDIKIQNRD
ncbi:MAG: MBL fold metallo-hydrolase [Spirosomaceae bacterium]|nr:MBL fold metallo-hydrolase [Spirosomataceae bacterium]